MALEPGALLHERYRIEHVLARGGMGAIYRATDLSLNVQMAVKENLYTTEESTRQFRREATILANMRHPNLPRVTDHFVIPGQGQYLVMDFIDGEDLRERLDRVDFIPEEEVVTIGATICDALTYLHTREQVVLHRDIKPGNIKITPSGQPFLVDFGLAKVTQPGMMTTIGAQALTPGYAPPEQYGSGTDPRSDIYSLAATLYAALTNQVPEDAMARAMGSAHLVPIRKHNPQVSEAVALVIEKAMDVAPDKRYQTAEQFKQALLNAHTGARALVGARQQTALSGSQSSDPAGATAKPAKARIAPAVFIIGGIALVGVCLVAGLLIANQFLNRNNQIALIEETATLMDLVPTEPSQPTATDEPTTAPIIAQDPTRTPEPEATATAEPVSGRWLAFASDRTPELAPDGAEIKPQVWLMDVDGDRLKLVTTPREFADGACQPAWSPDGRHLVVVSPCRKYDRLSDEYRNSVLWLIELDDRFNLLSRKPLRSEPGGDFDPAWSPDGTSIAFTSYRYDGIDQNVDIFITTLADGVTRQLINDVGADRRPVWSPDGTRILFQSFRNGQSGAYIINADGTGLTLFSTNNVPAYFPVWAPDAATILYVRGSNLQPALKPAGTGANVEDYLLSAPIISVYDPQYYWDGFEIIYAGIKDNQTDLFMTDTTGATPRNLTNTPANEFHPAWRPLPEVQN